ncbi:MAG: hypothetical protein RJB66_717 [Pseudomonadota bacterium]|jgi:SAM-dependent methyltransferase
MIDSIGFAVIDENGVVLDHLRQPVSDPDVLEEFFAELTLGASFEILSKLHGEPVLVEAFDEPIIANNLELIDSNHKIKNVYGYSWNFELSSLVVDEWDRFHGITINGLPFVLSNQAQDQLFTQLDEFDDDSITFQGETYSVSPYWNDEIEVESESYWTSKYQLNQAGWDLGSPAHALKSIVPKLKLPSSRVLVLGGGQGHDAGYFADLGHHVTLVDISPEALALAQKSYGDRKNIRFIEADLFDLPQDMIGQFDLIIEHTCFCAINPSLRNDLVRQWRLLLNENGFLLGVFFAMPKRSGPPFGASEREIRRRLEKGFQTLIWQRFRQSIKPRLGRELLVYIKKK